MLYLATEHSVLTAGADATGSGEIGLPGKVFEQLAAYALGEEAAPVLHYFVQRGRPCLRIDAYVGLLRVHERVSLEILPKLTTHFDSAAVMASRLALLRMLQAVPALFPRPLPEARLHQLAGLSVPDALAALFLEKAGELIHRGLRTSYQPTEAELPFVKGRLQLHRRPWSRVVRPARVPVSFDERTRHHAPNRLLKACLQSLQHGIHARQVRQYLFAMEDIPASSYWPHDLATARNHSREFGAYAWLWPWAEWLLGGLAPGFTEGRAALPGLLFPTQMLFENYVAMSLRRHLPAAYDVQLQEAAHHLLYDPAGLPAYRLRPDVVIRRGEKVWVLDMKWKKIRGDDRRFSHVAQSDLYQLYAYGQRYLATGSQVKLALLYPQTPDFAVASPPWAYEPHLPLYLLPADLSVSAPQMVAQLWKDLGE